MARAKIKGFRAQSPVMGSGRRMAVAASRYLRARKEDSWSFSKGRRSR